MPTYLAPPAVPSANPITALQTQTTDQPSAATIHRLVYLQQDCTNNDCANSVVHHQLTNPPMQTLNPHQNPMTMQQHMSCSVPYGLHALHPHQSYTASVEALRPNNRNNETPIFIQSSSQYCHNRKDSRGKPLVFLPLSSIPSRKRSLAILYTHCLGRKLHPNGPKR